MPVKVNDLYYNKETQGQYKVVDIVGQTTVLPAEKIILFLKKQPLPKVLGASAQQYVTITLTHFLEDFAKVQNTKM